MCVTVIDKNNLDKCCEGSYICSADNDKIIFFGEGNENDILAFISQKIGINKGLLQFHKQKIIKWKETYKKEAAAEKN